MTPEIYRLLLCLLQSIGVHMYKVCLQFLFCNLLLLLLCSAMYAQCTLCAMKLYLFMHPYGTLVRYVETAEHITLSTLSGSTVYFLLPNVRDTCSYEMTFFFS